MEIKHISTGYKPQFWQGQVHGALKRFNVLVLHRRAGKALDIMTPIWTINGFKYMRDIVEGDIVFGGNGRPTKVVGVSEIMLTKRCFKLTFDDGAEIVADAEHLWYTETKLNRAATKVIDGKRTLCPKKGTVKTTLELFNTQIYQNESNHSIPVTIPVEYEEKKLPIDPYILGVWLGDGTSRAAEITTSFPYIQDKLRGYCKKSGWTLTLKKGEERAPTFYLKGGFKILLRELNLLENKHIPDMYLKSSVQQRKALLAGLMDTDGYITDGESNKCEFVQKRKELMDQVCVLMSSLGLKYSRKIKVVNGVDYHLILFAPLFNVFTIPYKSERHKKSSYHKNRYIKSIVEVESVPVKCIAVDNEDKIYLAGERFIPTHNTVFSINEMIDQGLRCNLKNPKYAYLAPTYKQASIIAWDYLLEYTKNLPGVEVHKKDLAVTVKRPPPWDDKIEYRLLGSDNPDSLRGIYLDGGVIDEYAQCDPIIWGEILRPALSDRKGWCIFIGCVVKDTLILGEQGLEEIGTSPIGYSDEDKKVYGLGGFHKAENRYGNPKLPTIKIRSRAGLELEATPNHRIWTPDGWVRMDELRVGSRTFMQYNQQVYGTESCDLDFAYLLGLYLAEGCYERKIYRLTISNPDEEIITFLKTKYQMTCHDGMHSRLNSKEFMEEFLQWVPDAGLVKAKEKSISQRILRLNKECMQMFLRGYIDGDGTYNKSKQTIVCSTASEKLSKQLQCLFLNMGYRSSRSSRLVEPSELVKVPSKVYIIAIDGSSAYKYSREIGTNLHRYANIAQGWKLRCGHGYWFKRGDFGPLPTGFGYLGRVNIVSKSVLDKIDPEIKYDRQLLADCIVEITPSSAETFDFCIPETHSYFSNGYASHNTPKGKNHFYERYNKAVQNPAWFTKILRADESGIIPKAELEEMRLDMTEDEFEQEMLCNFASAAPGVYYGKLMAQLRRDNRIRSVPYDPSVPVDTFWDLGIGDSTAIWFRQRVGINWHYIDYYEKSGEGLEHFVKELRDRPYAYGRHVVPHDAAARDLSTGMTRQEFLRKLGLRVEIQKRQAVDDRIQATRVILPKSYFDEVKCQRGVSALEDYQKEWDGKLMMYKNKPFHNWTSHGADAFGYSALDIRDSDFEGGEYGKKLPEMANNSYDEFGGV